MPSLYDGKPSGEPPAQEGVLAPSVHGWTADANFSRINADTGTPRFSAAALHRSYTSTGNRTDTTRTSSATLRDGTTQTYT